MFRHLPILLIIFATTSAHAEQGFFEQVLELVEEQNHDDKRTGRRTRRLDSPRIRTACPAADNDDTPPLQEALPLEPPASPACATAAA